MIIKVTEFVYKQIENYSGEILVGAMGKFFCACSLWMHFI